MEKMIIHISIFKGNLLLYQVEAYDRVFSFMRRFKFHYFWFKQVLRMLMDKVTVKLFFQDIQHDQKFGIKINQMISIFKRIFSAKRLVSTSKKHMNERNSTLRYQPWLKS